MPSLDRRPFASNAEAKTRIPIASGWEAASCPPDTRLHPSDLEGLEWVPTSVPGTAAKALLDAGRWRQGEPYDFDSEDWWFRTSFASGGERPAGARGDGGEEGGASARPAGGEQVLLRLGGIATCSEVFLNGVKLLESDSMFASHVVDVGDRLEDVNELAIRCRALGPMLSQQRKPRARWRTKLVSGGLRFHRTMLLGRASGIAPGPAAVGPWRPVELVHRRSVAIEGLTLRTSVEGEGLGTSAEGEPPCGLLSVEALLRPLHSAPVLSAHVVLSGPSGEHEIELALSPDAADGGTALSPDTPDGKTALAPHAADGETGCIRANGLLKVPHVALWWPHTHGQPSLHRVQLRIETAAESVLLDAGHVGFRTLRAGAGPHHHVETDGLQLHVNGVKVFARGAVWITPDPVGLAPDEETLSAAVRRAVDAGMNMLRIPGTSAYESPELYDLCDRLGVLLWQDFMFANLDYPIGEESFRATVEQEAQSVLCELAPRPSLAVLCGNSEIEQQVAMLGLDPSLGRGELFGELLPSLIAKAGSDAIYVPSAPCGGELPFRPNVGIANYYGVGGYLRPIEDARRSEVKFAAECLAFSNVPNEAGVRAVLPRKELALSAPDAVAVPALDAIAASPSDAAALPARDLAAAALRHPAWKAGVPKDAGAEWDFEDVRDHYLKLLFDVDPQELRKAEPERYLELSRAVSGEVMSAVLGEWRRSQSPCGGALLLWLSDLSPGAGWGIVDRSGAPKPAYHYVRRALAPVAVWMVDEGLGGLRVHASNDGPSPLSASLRLSLYKAGQQRVSEVVKQIEMQPHSTLSWDVEGLLGRFVDVSWAYRFGPPGQDVVVASLERPALGGLKRGGGEDAGVSEDARSGEPRPEILSQAFHFPAGRPIKRESAQELGLQARIAEPEGWRPNARPRLILCTKRIVYGVRVHAEGLDAADDSFSLEPGVGRVVEMEPLKPVPSVHSAGQTEAVPRWTVSAINLAGRLTIYPENER